MRVPTGADGSVVPPGRALWVPAGPPHAVSMRGGVAMQALFVRRDAAAAASWGTGGRDGARGSEKTLSRRSVRCMKINNLAKPPQQYDDNQRLHHMCVLYTASGQVMRGRSPL